MERQEKRAALFHVGRFHLIEHSQKPDLLYKRKHRPFYFLFCCGPLTRGPSFSAHAPSTNQRLIVTSAVLFNPSVRFSDAVKLRLPLGGESHNLNSNRCCFSALCLRPWAHAVPGGSQEPGVSVVVWYEGLYRSPSDRYHAFLHTFCEPATYLAEIPGTVCLLT